MNVVRRVEVSGMMKKHNLVYTFRMVVLLKLWVSMTKLKFHETIKSAWNSDKRIAALSNSRRNCTLAAMFLSVCPSVKEIIRLLFNIFFVQINSGSERKIIMHHL